MSTLFLAAAEIAPADSAIQRAIENVQDLQIQLILQVNKLTKALETIDTNRAALSNNTLKREFVNLWTPIPYFRPISEIIGFSRQKNLLALNYYAKNNDGKILFSFTVIMVLGIFLLTLKRRLSKGKELSPDFAGQLVFRHPICSAVFIGVNLLQFLFQDPPFIFGMLFWIISALCLTIIFWGYVTKFSMKFWLMMGTLFLLACFNNLILQASRQERWWMLVVALAGVVVGGYFLLKNQRDQLKEKSIIYFICFVVVLEFFAVVFDVFGRYNLSKTLLVSGYINVIIGIEFLWTARLLHEMLLVTSRFYSRSEKKPLYYSFEKVGYKVPPIFYFLFFVGWFVLFARNFYSFRLITDPLTDMLIKEHTIGNYSFTVTNLLVFIVIMVVATLLSKIVSFFASDKEGIIPDKNSPKSKLGSWILLIRITIISCGLFLASAAAGIPMDRITLILGALGVGIGFGLQELTGSLVSGIIIAFEKPVNVGDIVDVAEQSGTMKSIGFRSSVITSWDGADVIIPNGTLLSSNLINWTMSNEKRRVHIEVELVVGTDLKKVKNILLELLNADERILKQPPPAVEFINFKNGTVDLHIYFWVVQIQEWTSTRSDVILEIDRIFKENDIVMAAPKT
jgi:small-conductance mechanosensitive channel